MCQLQAAITQCVPDFFFCPCCVIGGQMEVNKCEGIVRFFMNFLHELEAYYAEFFGCCKQASK